MVAPQQFSFVPPAPPRRGARAYSPAGPGETPAPGQYGGQAAPRSTVETTGAPDAQPETSDKGDPPCGKVRLLIADDHRIFREGLHSMLAAQPDFEVVGEASNGAEAVELARALRPDVVVMDVGMPRLSGIDATRQITAAAPAVRVVGLSMHESGDVEARMKQAGAVAYLEKSGPIEALMRAIRAAVR